MGIINACVRLNMVTDDQVRFCVEGEEGLGTSVTIEIPWNKNNSMEPGVVGQGRS